MSFVLSTNVDASKVFLVGKESLGTRWDPHFHSPRFAELDTRLDAVRAEPLRQVARSIFSGITPLSGGDAYTESKDGVAFIRSGDFNEDGTINEASLIRLKREVHSTLMRRSQLASNDVLFAIVGATIGKVGIFQEAYEANINQAVCAVRLGESVVPQFAHAFFLMPLGREQIERIKRPVARANINLEEIGTLRLPVLNEGRQKAVVQAIRKAFAEKTAKDSEASRLLATIDDMLLAELGIPRKPEPPSTIESRMFCRAFGQVTGQRLDPLYYQGDIYWFVRDAACELVRFGGLTDYFLTGFAAGRGDQGDEDGGVIQIRPTNISDDRDLIFRRNVYLSPAEIESRPADLLKRGEVLFNNTNSQELVGKTTVFDREGPYFSSNHITRIGTKAAELDPIYLAYVLNLYQRKRVFFRVCTNWNNQSGVGVDVLQQMPIPLPRAKTKTVCLARQREIVERLDAIREQSRQMRSQAAADLERAKREIEALILGKASGS